MSDNDTDFEAMVQARLNAAAEEKTDRDEKAANIIWAAVFINAGASAIPLGANTLSFFAVNSLMAYTLSTLYDNDDLSREEAGQLVRRILNSVGRSWLIGTLGLKAFAEILKIAGLATFGASTAVGVALDALLSGEMTYAVGFTARAYFIAGEDLSTAQLRAEFKQQFERGKREVKARTQQGE